MSDAQLPNATRFIDAYNRVDRQLEGSRSDTDYVAFSKRVRESKQIANPVRDILLDYAGLRNVIVHTRGSHTGNPIADPRTEVVEKLEQIADQLENPPRVLAALHQQQVLVLDAHSDVAEFLDLVREQNFSQAPVRMSDGGLELVTTNSVSRWLASEYTASSGAAIEHATLEEVIKYSEVGDSILLRHKDLTVVQAWRLFAGLEKVAPPHALAITHSGKVSERPLGLVVRSDLPELLRVLL